MNTKVLRAVFKRNFVAYFANPTGYLFICMFVLLSTVAAFWPNEFFNTNLANLDQLSFGPANPFRSFPFIMLVFIPAITMGVWADERRQGTDELLLTIPAADLDIVLGKYLAAVAIYSVSLLFSLGSNYSVLEFLGDPDVGLFLGTYVGYWLVGLAMLAIGMVASFLTANLTIAYILGAALNAPLVFAMFADNIAGGGVAGAIKQWSLGEQFRDFGRGIISFSGLVYFGMIAAVMLYLSMVLIGRRHWREAQGKLPNHVFYPLLHLGWLGSFATFWVVLKEYFDPTNTFICLAVLYLILHTALLWGWSQLAGRGESTPLDSAVAALHLAVVVGFAVVARVLWLSNVSTYVSVGAFILYLVLHGALLLAWWRLAGHAALLPGQYTVRALALAVTAVAAVILFNYYDYRKDVTSEQLSSLAPQTRKLLKELEIQRPVQVEAFISPEVPESYVQTRLNLLSMLREVEARGGEKVRLTINDTERFSEVAARAEQRYDITPREVTTMDRGTFSRDYLFMGVAFTCGLEKVIIPFIDRGIPVEYELARSIATVTQQERKKVGILDTDAQLYGRFNMQTMSSSGNWPIIDELEKQYEVERVDATSEITGDYHVLLAVQPSSLGPEQMENFVNAVRRGVPTAIFEDPLPVFAGNVPGTTAPRRPPGGANPFMGNQPPMEKGNLLALWDLLKIDFGADQVVWQDYNPYPKLSDLPEEFVFVDEGSGAEEPFSAASDATSGLQHMLFPFPGSIRKLNISKLKFTPLVKTSTRTGTVGSDDVFQLSMFGFGGDINPNRRQVPTNVNYVLAAHITGAVPAGTSGDGNGNGEDDEQDGSEADVEEEATGSEGSPSKEAEIDVVLVTDIDMLHRNFFRLREQGAIPEAGVHFDFDNVTFVLNVLDMLARDDRFMEIRKRRPKHRTLTRIEESTEQARRDTATSIEELRDEYEQTEKEEEDKLQKRIDKLEQEMKRKNLPAQEVLIRVAMAKQDAERRKQTKLEQSKQKRDKDINRIETELNLEVRQLQDTYKMWAVILPPIPPLAIGGIVFFTRRTREREGVARSRLRS